MGVSWELYAGKGKDSQFEHFYLSVLQVEMCGNKEAFLVRLTPDDEGDFYGWHYSDHPDNGSFAGQVSMIYRRAFLVEMCFPYGLEAEVKRGRGNLVRLRVEEIRPAKKGEGIRLEAPAK